MNATERLLQIALITLLATTLSVGSDIAATGVITVPAVTVTNINPDLQGTPWLVGGYHPPAEELFLTTAEIKNKLTRLNRVRSRDRVDHSFSDHMRPVFSQAGGSCGSASRICYMFAYELNCFRNLSGDPVQNRYPSHFTWLLTEQNSGKAQMAIANGIPNAVDYDGDRFSALYGGDIDWPTEGEDDYGWMHLYEQWYNAMFNRLDHNSAISLTAPENLLLLKSWLNDHHGDTDFPEGGVAGAGCAITGAVYAQIPAGEYEEGMQLVRQWGPQVDHGTTWSGYDDEVGYDFNDDGMITNDIDTNGDELVNMADWERGALIMLNSWGSGWKNDGTVYVPYRLLYTNNMNAEFYYIRKNYTPQHVLKVNLTYSQRRQLKLSIGIAADPTATEPDDIVPCHHFNYAGLRDVALLGIWADDQEHTEQMELGYDLTDLTFGFDTGVPFRYFLQIESTPAASGQGTVYTTSVMDYSSSQEGEEIASSYTLIPIAGNGATTLIPIDMPGSPGGNPYLIIPQSELAVHYYDSAQPGADSAPGNLLDGDVSTIWHTVWGDGDPPPHEIQLDLGAEYEVGAVKYLPRQVGANGRIADYEIYISLDDNDWGEPVATGTWPNTTAEQVAIFAASCGRYLRLRALSEVNGGPWTSIAELNVLQAPQPPYPDAPANVQIFSHITTPGENLIALTWDEIAGCHYYVYRADNPLAPFPEGWVCLNPQAPLHENSYTTTLQLPSSWFRVTADYD